MPLLKKKQFQKAVIPELLRDDEEVYYCKITNEVFRNYDDFCERIILVNSMVWSCSLTGKSNLTYAEALECEKSAKRILKDFPKDLKIPILFIASKTQRTNFTDMSDDVFYFVKDRFFIGECIESTFTENNWHESVVRHVIPPTDQEIANYFKTNNLSTESQINPPACLYRYEVEQMDVNDQDSTQVMILEAKHIRRKKGFTKEKNRMFLKQFVELDSNGYMIIKRSAHRKYKILNMTFDKIFDGPVPQFEKSIKAQKTVTDKKKKQQQQSISTFINKSTVTSPKNLLEEMRRKEEEYKQKIELMKQKKIEEKILEKQKRKEENMKMSLYVREWFKPREDLQLEDQKILPTPQPVTINVPSKYIGDILMLIEFVNSFSTILHTKNYFPNGLNLDLMERALIKQEVAGPLTDLLDLLLTALFSVQEEETAGDKITNIEVNTDDMSESMTLSDATRYATLALNWSKVYQGVPLNKLPLCPLTISEVLRLHLLSSGARLNEIATKWKLQQRENYTSEDDPGLHLRIKYPYILKALSIHNVNQLPLGDKIKILTCLVDQLLTYAHLRDLIEERLEKVRQLKIQVRSLQTSEKKNEQEVISNRQKIKRENKGNQEIIDKELEKLEKENDKKRHHIESRIKESVISLSDIQTILGYDRAYQKYMKIANISGIFIENNEKNLEGCFDKIVEQKPELIDAEEKVTLLYVKKLFEECNGSDKENNVDTKKKLKKGRMTTSSLKSLPDVEVARKLLMCTANHSPCPVHSDEEKPRWFYYNTSEDLEKLISALNKRGIRENELRQNLELYYKYIKNIVINNNLSELFSKMDNKYEDSNLGYPNDTTLSYIFVEELIDNILEMEEKLFDGNLGSIKVKNRLEWRKQLKNKNFAELEKLILAKEDLVDKIKLEEKNSRPGTPDSIHKDPGKYLGPGLETNGHYYNADNDEITTVMPYEQCLELKALAMALLQVAQGIDPKYLRKPLGHVQEKKKEKVTKVDVIHKWEQSLLCSTNYSQIFLHFCTLDNCIMWQRSLLRARCKVCNRLCNPELMLLCDKCDKGFHLYCLKPKLTKVPEGDWFCNKCEPPKEVRKTRKKVVDYDEAIEIKDEDDNHVYEDTQDNSEKNGNVNLIEVCEECGSGGHVICCDFCPSVYHLQCTKPPLRRIPRGDWKCHRCKSNELSNKSVKPLQKSGAMVQVQLQFNKNQSRVKLFPRRCASNALAKIHGFTRSLSRTSVDSSTSEELPQRRSTRRKHVEDDVALHNVALQELLSEILKHEDAWPFTKPVTKHEVPDYYEVIKKPMDFGKIKYKLNMGDYTSDAEVFADAALIFENCDTYNNSEATVYKCGYRLLKFVEKRAKELGFDFPQNLMGGSDSTTSSDDEDNSDNNDNVNDNNDDNNDNSDSDDEPKVKRSRYR